MNLRETVEAIENTKLYKGQDRLQKIVSELDTCYDGTNLDKATFKEELINMRF